jgi:hypothetical protein
VTKIEVSPLGLGLDYFILFPTTMNVSKVKLDYVHGYVTINNLINPSHTSRIVLLVYSRWVPPFIDPRSDLGLSRFGIRKVVEYIISNFLSTQTLG